MAGRLSFSFLGHGWHFLGIMLAVFLSLQGVCIRGNSHWVKPFCEWHVFFRATEVCAELKDLELLEGFRGST